ncbi:MAG: DUF1214 domain-containing protein [Acidimicrobiales bacterium]|nr:DUF1214 domain-containing protein [Acidimicrobiales bacterium]
MGSETSKAAQAWSALVDGLKAAGEQLAVDTADLDPIEQADAFRALLRGLNNQLGRFEVDRERPELLPFNGWRQKMFMDNPDFLYWVADIRDDRRYRISGSVGDAAYTSITAYSASGALTAEATGRTDSDRLGIDSEGNFALTVSREPPADGGDWLELPEGASVVWVRHFHDDAANDRIGWCRIEPLDAVAAPAPIEPGRFAHRLERLGQGIGMFPSIFAASVADDLAHPNEVRHWSEMAGGSAFTEPNISYLRGAWELEQGEALVLEGDLVACRYWSVLLYSRHLNSLDHRNRRVSLTGARARIVDGRYRIVLAASDPGDGDGGGGWAGDWLDTEGRRFGLVVFRFLQTRGEVALPAVRRCRLDELGGDR